MYNPFDMTGRHNTHSLLFVQAAKSFSMSGRMLASHHSDINKGCHFHFLSQSLLLCYWNKLMKCYIERKSTERKTPANAMCFSFFYVFLWGEVSGSCFCFVFGGGGLYICKLQAALQVMQVTFLYIYCLPVSISLWFLDFCQFVKPHGSFSVCTSNSNNI